MVAAAGLARGGPGGGTSAAATRGSFREEKGEPAMGGKGARLQGGEGVAGVRCAGPDPYGEREGKRWSGQDLDAGEGEENRVDMDREL